MQPLFAMLGVTPTLTVQGRSSGHAYTFPVLPLDFGGRTYVLAPRGNTQWARNLRASGKAELKRDRRRRPVRATEIQPPDNTPMVEAYVRQYGPKYGGFVAREFAAMPDPAHHPTFLLEDL